MLSRGGLALLGGFLLYAGHPPLGLGPVGFVALVPIVALARDLQSAPIRSRFGYGLLAGMLAFGPLLYWLIPFGYAAFGGLVLVESVYIGTFVTITASYGERRGRAAFTVAAWVALEAIRGSWPLGGFGWGSLAYTQASGGPVLGVARSLGAAGVGMVLAITAVAIEQAIAAGRASWPAAHDSDLPADAVFRAMRTPILTVLGVLSVAILISGEAPAPSGDTTSFGIVQGGDTRATSAAGVNRIDIGRIVRVSELMLAQTRPFAADPPDVVVWPENSLDRDVRSPDGAQVREILDQALALVAPSPILAGETADGPRPGTLLNNMTVFDSQGVAVDSYSKRRPVPFAEYVPWRSLLGDLPPLRQVPSDVLAADAPQVLDVAGAQVGGVICFENTFPHLARSQVRAGADVLVVGTNNSSFGDTPMSAQHIAFSQLRAVETGRWVVHAGISGISAFISPEGRVMQSTELFQPAAIRMDIPLIQGLTPAMRLGDAVAWLAALATLIGLGWLALDRVRGPGRS
ncbi:MAG: apolipoprotein N-acyltransferase [Euzebya sp.]